MISLGQCIVHCKLVGPVLGPHCEVLLLQRCLFLLNFSQSVVELLRLFESEENVLCVSELLTELLDVKQLLLQLTLSLMKFHFFVLEDLLCIYEFLAHFSVLIEERLVLLAQSSFRPARKHDQVIELSKPLLFLGLRGELTDGLDEGLILVLPPLQDQLQALDLITHSLIHILVGEQGSLSLHQISLQLFVMRLQLASIVTLDRLLKMLFKLPVSLFF